MFLHYFTNDPSFPFFIQYGEHDTPMPAHFHADFTELVIVLNGTAMHRVDNEEYLIKKGDVFVINGRTSHSYHDTDTLRICNIMYQAEQLHKDGRDLPRSAGYQALFVIEPFLAREYHFKSRLHLSYSDHETVREMVDGMIREYHDRLEGYQALVYARFLELVVFLSRHYARLEPADQGSLIHIAKAVSFMENHFRRQVSLPEIAAEAHLSPRHFSRLFRRQYAMSPMHYLLTLRIRHACDLLRQSNLGISEVAWQSGFEDSNYFSRQFRQITGVAPRDYRGGRSASGG